jgi:hypothetical protein
MVLRSVFSCAQCSFSYTFLWSVGSSHLTTYTGLSYFSLLISLLCFAIFIFGGGVFWLLNSVPQACYVAFYHQCTANPDFSVLCHTSLKKNHFPDGSLVCVSVCVFLGMQPRAWACLTCGLTLSYTSNQAYCFSEDIIWKNKISWY